MYQTIVIRPSKAISINSSIKGQYFSVKDNVQCTLTMDKRVVFGTLKETDKVFYFKFGKYNASYTNKINIAETDQVEKKRAEDEKKFWAKHPQVNHVDGDNKYMTNPLFDMEVLEDIEEKKNKEDREWLKIQNQVNNLDDKNRYDLCFFFGGNPTNKTADQVWADLIGREGRLFYKDNRDKFSEIMTDEKKLEVVDRTITKKAIHYGIIVTENNKYWTKQRDLLGMNEDDIYLYYKGNPDAFNYIKQEVSAVDINSSTEIKKLTLKKSA